MKQILINAEPFEKRVAIIADGTLEEFYSERPDYARMAGNIYKGVIESVVPGIGALFVNLGTGKNGFLYIKDFEGKGVNTLLDEEVEVGARSSDKPQASKTPKKGMEVLVQVVKEPISTKGPLLTTDISLPGKYIVFMPFNDTVGVSKKVEDQKERATLKEMLKKLYRPKGAGCIARTQSIGVKERKIELEFKYLSKLWERIRFNAEKSKAPSLAHQEHGLPLRIIRDYFDENTEKVLVDSREEYKNVYKFICSINPDIRKRIFFYKGKTDLFEKFGIEESIEAAFKRKVFLKSGGYLIIEQTEGLSAIDVNTGKFVGKRDPENTVFKTNMEAAQEIPRQVMLRNIGGIIVIDFIDMNRKDNRKRVYETLEKAFQHDKAKINILTISPIGLVEMTRQRVRKSLESTSSMECPYCNGMGHIKTPTTIAIESLRRLKKTLMTKRSHHISLVAHPDIVREISANFANFIRFLEKKFRKRITIKTDQKLHVEDVYFE